MRSSTSIRLLLLCQALFATHYVRAWSSESPNGNDSVSHGTSEAVYCPRSLGKTLNDSLANATDTEIDDAIQDVLEPKADQAAKKPQIRRPSFLKRLAWSFFLQYMFNGRFRTDINELSRPIYDSTIGWIEQDISFVLATHPHLVDVEEKLRETYGHEVPFKCFEGKIRDIFDGPVGASAEARVITRLCKKVGLVDKFDLRECVEDYYDRFYSRPSLPLAISDVAWDENPLN